MSAPAGALKGSLGGAKSLFWEKRTGHGPVVRRASTPLSSPGILRYKKKLNIKLF